MADAFYSRGVNVEKQASVINNFNWAPRPAPAKLISHWATTPTPTKLISHCQSHV